MGAAVSRAYAVALQSNGNIIALGDANDDFALASFTSNGTLSQSFSGSGKVLTNLSGSDHGNGLYILQDDSIIAAGSSNSGHEFAMVHYSSTGELKSYPVYLPLMLKQ